MSDHPVIRLRTTRGASEPPPGPGLLTVCQAVGGGVVELRPVGPGSDLSEELVVGASQSRWIAESPPDCPPGLAANRGSSAIMIRQTRSARRRTTGSRSGRRSGFGSSPGAMRTSSLGGWLRKCAGRAA
jgi:hypothetical protein